MKSIDITTTQKVIIQYELANLRDRFFAWFVDMCIIFGLMIVLSILFGLLNLHYSWWEYFGYLVMAPIFLFYTLVSEILMDGQTFGKKGVGIKVVKLNGKEPNSSDHFIRWTFRMIDIYFSSGSIAATLVSSSPNNQRFGDMAANTVVIKTSSSLQFSLREILNIESIEQYQPKYPQVRQLAEKDMVLIKNAILRLGQYNNKAHQEAIIDLSGRICQILDIPYQTITNHTQFLRTLIKDYIVLTR